MRTRKYFRYFLFILAGVFGLAIFALFLFEGFAYIQWMSSPFSIAESDLNGDGFLSSTEADYFGNYGTRKIQIQNKECTEYYSLKDALPIKTVCE